MASGYMINILFKKPYYPFTPLSFIWIILLLALDVNLTLLAQVHPILISFSAWLYPQPTRKIKVVAFFFKPYKAPSTNGLHPFIYQKYWDTFAPLLLDFCTQTFFTAIMNPRVNSSYICLILNCRNATTLKNFRPIGLCNTQYKIIMNLISNRIKPFLQSLIVHNQDNFLSNKRTFDNVIIVLEYIDHFKKMKGKIPHMLLKIDFKKAFDIL